MAFSNLTHGKSAEGAGGQRVDGPLARHPALARAPRKAWLAQLAFAVLALASWERLARAC